MTPAIERLAVYIANLFFSTSDTSAPVLKDRDLTEEVAGHLLSFYVKMLF